MDTLWDYGGTIYSAVIHFPTVPIFYSFYFILQYPFGRLFFL